MPKLKIYLYYVFLIAFLAISWGVFKVTNLNFVFNFLDTYYIIQYSDISILLIFPTLLIALLYWLFSKTSVELVKSLVRIHTLTTIVGIVLLITITSFLDFISPLGTTSNFPLFDESENTSITLIILCLLIITSQLLFFLNIILSLASFFFRKNREKR
ncbi:hypothetical protein SAMN04489796_111103 [Winogradskyella thalassocola]|uniref:Uncharacterized protein n=1 Tax=Winogradskyella thalassocola TaxID=262004 RepID=A0A1G8KTP4_9FLAO|nr:hypothetical protein SAMN04489796_111103 [Winogradskyella thalassocola]